MPFFSCPLLRFCFVFLPSLLICEGFPFFPPASVFAFVSEARRQTCCLLLLLFFFSFCQAGKGLGGTAVRNLQHSESGSCLWMSVSLSPLLDALEDILYECVLSAAGRQRCFIAVGFKETLKLFSPFYPSGYFIDLSAWETCRSECVCLSRIIHAVQPGPVAGYFRVAVNLFLLHCWTVCYCRLSTFLGLKK